MAKEKDKNQGWGPSWLILLIAFILVCLFSAAGLLAQMLDGSDMIERASSPLSESTIIYSADGTVLGTIHAGEKRMSVPTSQISPYLIKAVIASEDNDFFSHKGISLKSMARAAFANLTSGKVVQGGSTITQQLARTLFLSTERTFKRKLNEMYYALELERRYTKEEILEMYLNQVYWGHNTYGADAAAQMYFGKHAQGLTLSEAAMMAGLLGAPEIYSPYKNFALAASRRDLVIDKMLRLGMINERESRTAKAEKISISMGKINKYKFNAPYFTNFVVNQLVQKYGTNIVYKGGLRVYTTLLMPVQKNAEESVNKFISEEGKKYNFSQTALLAVSPNNGHILAMVGGADFDKSEFNRAAQSKRSPGSSFKPFIYTAAMEKRMSPGDILSDAPITFDVFPTQDHPDGKWRPKNFDRKFRGNVTLQYALENSLNIPAIKLLQKVGIDNAVNMARRMGITSDLSQTLSLALGTSDVSLLEMVSAFGVLATGGEKSETLSILKVTDKNGKILEEDKPSTTRVIDQDTAAMMVLMMKGVIASGTGVRANIGRSAAAKTGTSDNFKDAWFIGFVPQLVAGVWVGNDNNAPMKGVAEVGVCPRIWKYFMQKTLKDIPAQEFPGPENAASVQICVASGLLKNRYCPANKIKWGTFWPGKAPKRECNVHGPKEVPSEDIEERDSIPEGGTENGSPEVFKKEVF
ncbi:MAG: penicillin-binding protein 1A [Candidatus Margulisiibacteriota bacterium]